MNAIAHEDKAPDPLRSSASNHETRKSHIRDRDAQQRAQHEADDLVEASQREEDSFAISREIGEIYRDESHRRTRSVLIETPLARWCQSRRKAARS